MALIKCPECGKEVSSDCKLCPNCGKQLKKPVAPIVLSILALLISLWTTWQFVVPVLRTFYAKYVTSAFGDFGLASDANLVLVLVVITALIASALLLVNARNDSKPLNTAGIALSVASLVLFAISTFLEGGLIVTFFVYITPPILTLIAGFKLRK